MAVRQYMMYDQNCLTLSMGDRDEVPFQQKQIIKELGLKYRGRGKWSYFVSFKKKIFPYHINNDELNVFIKAIERLIDIMQNYCQHNVDVDYDKEEMIYEACIRNDTSRIRESVISSNTYKTVINTK